jgi:hypothetical protein
MGGKAAGFVRLKMKRIGNNTGRGSDDEEDQVMTG